jgi:hypothetical protein
MHGDPPTGLQAEREALGRLVAPATPAGWNMRQDATGITLRWQSGHQEEIVVRAEVLGSHPAMPAGCIGGVWPLGNGWLRIDCLMTDPSHPRCWAAAGNLLARLQPESPALP